MDLEEIKGCLRALITSTKLSYNTSSLLQDFKKMTGFNLPLFGYANAIEFLKTLDDTLQLFGNPFNPVVALVESKKSAHITSLVDRQKSQYNFYPNSQYNQTRCVIPSEKNEIFCDTSKNNFIRSQDITGRSTSAVQTTKCQPDYIPPLMSIQTSFENQQNSASESITLNQFFNQQITSTPKIEKSQKNTLTSSQEFLISESCYFEDISDNGSCLSSEGSKSSSGQAASASCCFVNDGIKNKLKKLIKNYPSGLWCCELPELFLKEFNFALDYREFGHTSLIQMVSELPDVFRCVRPANEDWILFDASVAPSLEEKRITNLQMTENLNPEIKANSSKVFPKFFDNSLKDRMSKLYEKVIVRSEDFSSLDMEDIKYLLEMWKSGFSKVSNVNEEKTEELLSRATSSFEWEEAVPPVTAENDLFVDIFPQNVVGPEENLLELDLTRHIAVGHVVEVCVAEVWSPSRFYVHLYKFENRLNQFMEKLQNFYNHSLNKFKMPESTIRSNQICVGLYNSDPQTPEEWHRARIIRVINDKTVLVNLVDYGTVARIKKTHLRFLHRSFQSFPIQAILAKLAGVEPPDDNLKWPMTTSEKFLDWLRVPFLNAEMVEIDFKEPMLSVLLFPQKSRTSINEKLLQDKLAKVKTAIRESNGFENKPEQESELNPNQTESLKSCLFSNKDEGVVKDLETSNANDEFKTVLGSENNSNEEKSNSKTTEEEIEVKVLEFEENQSEPTHPSDEPESLRQDEKISLPEMTVELEQTLTKKAKPPPGLENVNKTNEFVSLSLSESLKKKVENLALTLLATKPSIKQVAVYDPMLAFKIATEMAEAYLSSSDPLLFNPLINPLAFQSLFTFNSYPIYSDFGNFQTG